MDRLKDCVSRQTFETHVDKIRARWKHRERMGPTSSSHGSSAIKEESGSETVRLKSPSLPEGSPHHQRRSSGSFPPSERKGSVKPEAPCSGGQTSRQTSPERRPGSDIKGGHPPSSHFVSPTNRHSAGMDIKPSISGMTSPLNATHTSPVRRSGITPTPAPGGASGKRKFGESASPLASPTTTSTTNVAAHRILSQSPNGNRDAGKMPKLTSDMRSPRWDHRSSGFSDSPPTKHSNDSNNNNSNSSTTEKSPPFSLRSPKEVSPQHMRKGSSVDARLHLPRSHTISTKLSSVPTDTSPSAANKESPITPAPSDRGQVDRPVSHAMGRSHTTDISPNGQSLSMKPNGVLSPTTRSPIRGRGRGRGRGSRITAPSRTVSSEKDPGLVSPPKSLGAPSSQPTREPTTTTLPDATAVKVPAPPPVLMLPPKPMVSPPPPTQLAPSGPPSSVTQEAEVKNWPQPESLNRDLNQSKETTLPPDVPNNSVTVQKKATVPPTPCSEPTTVPSEPSPPFPSRMAGHSGVPKGADDKSTGLILPSTGVSSEPSATAVVSVLPTAGTSQPPSSEGVAIRRGSHMGVSTVVSAQISPRSAAPPEESLGSAEASRSSAPMVPYPQHPMASMPPGMTAGAPMRPHMMVTSDHPRPMRMSPQMPPVQRRPSLSVSGAPGRPQPPPSVGIPPHSMSSGATHSPFPSGNHPMMYAGGPQAYHQHGPPPPGYGPLPPGYPHPHAHAPPPHKTRPHPPPPIHTAQFSPPGSRRGSVSHSQVSFASHNTYSPSPVLQNHPSFAPNSASPHPYGSGPPTGSRPSPQNMTVAQFPTLPPHDPAVRMGRPPGPPHPPASAVPPHMHPRRGSGPVSAGVLGSGSRPQAPPIPNRSFSIGGPSPPHPLGHPPPGPPPPRPSPYSRKSSFSTASGAYPPGMLPNQMRPVASMVGGVPSQPLPAYSQSMQTHGGVPFPPGYQEAPGPLPPNARGPPQPPHPHSQHQQQYQPYPQLTMASTMGGRVPPSSSSYRPPMPAAPPSTAASVMESKEPAVERDTPRVTDAPAKNKSALDFIMNTSEESGSGNEPQDNSYMSWFN
ncbi:hypothetical protein IWQ62_004815 [Dispira parvispora]|uniref:Uncharacterized protein n=1 Tax=Dispira parvispora TaxID=1520584 RepID=A0A9W8E095_9FUNG|nr:hypothetical protein IWQ62_004815 [Dispira parvispora]